MRVARVGALALALDATAPALATEDFPVPPEIAPAVRFWVEVFTRWSRNDVVIHDRVEPGRVYEVVQDVPWGREDVLAPRVDRVLADLRLRRLWGPDPIERLLRPELTAVLGEALDRDRIRLQRGMREVFADGLVRARRFLPMVRGELSRAGVPVALAALPLVESSYHPGATSSAGASGMWQLTADTAERWAPEGSVDRRDPVQATRAAARFLAHLHDLTGSWPLAITAYNHGPSGVMRARRVVGTDDLGALVTHYRGPGFGFASRNFYAEFLAALHVQRHADRYFTLPAPEPPVVVATRAAPRRGDRIVRYRVKPGDSLANVARRHGVTITTLRSANRLRSSRLKPGQRLVIRL